MLTQDDVFRAMKPGQRIRAMRRVYSTMRRLAEAGERMRHPDWTDAQVQQALAEAFRRARR